ncbi:MAG TPA: energy transducer TonB [Pyrinomonadaceae bacterium]|nr:energy transducer TonB [Pyrinomonadaceae bacterium]
MNKHISRIALALVALSFSGIASAQIVDQEAKLKSLPKLEKRPISERHMFGTKLTVNVSVDEKGNVIAVQSITGPGDTCQDISLPEVVAIRKAAEAIAFKAKFDPAIGNGEKVASSAAIEIEFPTMVKAMPVTESESSISTSRGYTSTGDNVIAMRVKESGETSAASANEKSAKPSESNSGVGGLGVQKDEVALSPSTKVNDDGTLPGGVLNGKPSVLSKPVYPAAARAVRASGSVNVQVLIGEDGKILSATPISGHPLLRTSARHAACSSRFGPTTLSGVPVKVSGIITYNFVP